MLRSKSWENGKFWKAYTSMNAGLGIGPQRSASIQEAQKSKLPRADSGKHAMQLLDEILMGSPFEELLTHARSLKSLREESTLFSVLHNLDVPNAGAMRNEADDEEEREETAHGGSAASVA